MIPEKFQHILRVMNTNVDGRRKIMFALTAIKVCLFIFLIFIRLKLTDEIIVYFNKSVWSRGQKSQIFS